jgi:hypothetical protein
MKGRKQHYIPQFYLRNFTTENQKGKPVLWIYDKDGSCPREQTTVNSMAEYGFYDFEDTKGNFHGVDFGLQQIEQRAAPILRHLEEPNVILTYEEIAMFSAFLATMYIRVPRTLNAIEEQREIFAYETLKLAADVPVLRERVIAQHRQKYGSCLGTDEDLLRILAEPEKHFLVVRDHQAAVAESVKHIETIARLMYDSMNWTICRAPQDSFFITSDMPLCVFLPAGPGRGQFGGGFGQKQVQVTFPITPKLLLLIDWKRRQLHMTVGKEFVREKNIHMALNAERWIIANIRSRNIEDLVRRAQGTRLVPKFDRQVISADAAKRLRARANVLAEKANLPSD